VSDRPALSGEARISRVDTGNQVAIRDLVGRADVPVWALDERLRLVGAVARVVSSCGPARASRIRLASGHVVTAAAGQPLLTIVGWRRVAELPMGATVATSRSLPEPRGPASWPEHEVVMLAHLLGDGCVTRDPIYYCSRDEANLEVVEKAARGFGVGTRRTPGRGVTYVHFPMLDRQARGHTNPLYDWLRRLGVMGHRAWEKQLPAEVHQLSGEQCKMFLRHLWATDGSVTTSSSGRTRIYYATTSRRLAEDIQVLLARSGIGARIRATTASKLGKHQGWTVDVSGRDNMMIFLLSIGVHGGRGLRCEQAIANLAHRVGNPNVDVIPAGIWEYIQQRMSQTGVSVADLAKRLNRVQLTSTYFKTGVSRPRMTIVAAALGERRLADLATSDVRWERIVAIDPVDDGELFKVVVAGADSVLANLVIAGAPGPLSSAGWS